MWIERMQVEEGFLDGLDIEFSRGLNVIIGARGVGKTSILELIRYALRLQHVDERRARAAKQHAEDILANGRVLLTFVNGEQRQTVVRSAADVEKSKLSTANRDLPLVLGQNELERIGLDPKSRLRLVDAHAGVDDYNAESIIDNLGSQVESLTVQLRVLSIQQDGLRQQEILRPTIEKELRAAQDQEAAMLGRANSQVAELRMNLGKITTQIADTRRQVSGMETLVRTVNTLLQESIGMESSIEQVLSDLQHGSADQYIGDLQEIYKMQGWTSSAVNNLRQRITNDVERYRDLLVELDNEARPLRLAFEEYEIGAAAAAQRTGQLEQQLIEIDAGIQRASMLAARAEEIRTNRDNLMKQIDDLREDRWRQRQEAATLLSNRFEPRIHIRVDHYGDRTGYTLALAGALRGSGLQHNQLAEWLVERVSPQELVAAVEASDAGRLSMMGEITSGRVDKMVSHLADSEQLGEILTARIDDSAQFLLLVGRDYRSSEQLSTGQRCSVVLPLLLADPGRALLLDQPEDHLDNAYLVENTVRTLRARSGTSQTIIATHNANIPVLGDAETVICLESDGRRGFVRHIGRLSESPIVRTITELMEGGEDAFARRAAFYDHSSEQI